MNLTKLHQRKRKAKKTKKRRKRKRKRRRKSNSTNQLSMRASMISNSFRFNPLLSPFHLQLTIKVNLKTVCSFYYVQRVQMGDVLVELLVVIVCWCFSVEWNERFSFVSTVHTSPFQIDIGLTDHPRLLASRPLSCGHTCNAPRH